MDAILDTSVIIEIFRGNERVRASWGEARIKDCLEAYLESLFRRFRELSRK